MNLEPDYGQTGHVHVAVLQFASGADVSANLDVLAQLARESANAVPGGVDLLVAPEAAQVEFGPPEQSLADVAEPLDGPFVKGVGELARELQTTIVAGMFETPASSDTSDRAADGRVYNTLVALGPDGRLVATYRKIHLYDAFGVRESDRLLAGDARGVVLDVGGHRVGLLTCYDLRFPELARDLADQGGELLAVPAAWHRGPFKEDHWSTLVRARAVENTCYVAAAAQSPPHYCGRSAVVDPFGVVLSSLGEEPGWCGGEIRADRIADVRRRNPTLEHRRFAVVSRGDEA